MRRILLCLAAILAFSSSAGLAKGLTLSEVEDHMLNGNYSLGIFEATWAVEQGEAIVPLLEMLLSNEQRHTEESGFATGAFPFNAIWALAHIPSERSLRVLEQYRGKDTISARLAIQGFRLRQSKGDRHSEYGVLLLDQAILRKQPSETAEMLKEIRRGQQVKVLQYQIENPTEEGARGGPAVYARVQLVPTGEQGFIQRAGDDFPPFI